MPSVPDTPGAAAGVASAPVANADPWRRFMCVAYEGVILFGVVFFFAYGFSALTQFKGQTGPLRHAFQGFMFLVLGLYFVWFWTNGRRTLPMKTMGVQLVDTTGAPLQTPRAIVRYLAASAGWVIALALAQAVHLALILVVALPFAWTLVDRQRRTLYDLASGTRLVTGAQRGIWDKPARPAG